MPMNSGVQRLDINDPKDVQYLVDTGLAWRSGPQSLQTIFRFITEGDVTRKPERETPEVRAYLDKLTAGPQEEPDEEPVPQEAPVPQDVEQAPELAQSPLGDIPAPVTEPTQGEGDMLAPEPPVEEPPLA